MNKIVRFVFCAVVLGALQFGWSSSANAQAAAAASATDAASRVAFARAGHLKRGINVSGWFQAAGDPRGLVKEHFDSVVTAQDLDLIQSFGFDHVRLPIEPEPMLRRGQADQLPAEYLAYLDAAVKMILDRGMAVVLDIHASGEFKGKLATDDATAEEFTDFWRGFAKHYAGSDPERVFFEILNEPELKDPYRWYGIESRVAGVVRENAPNHTIIVEGTRWADDDDLLFMQPLRDRNVIYNFHFYEPHIFTHQGASWSENYFHFLRALPYPSNPENVKPAEDQVPDAQQRLLVLRYGYDRWGAARIDAEFALVADWAAKLGVPVVCNEFGVYRRVSDPKDRAAWLTDVRTSFEKHRIGWTMWDYDGGFGVVNRVNGQLSADELTVKALGLKVPAAAPASTVDPAAATAAAAAPRAK